MGPTQSRNITYRQTDRAQSAHADCCSVRSACRSSPARRRPPGVRSSPGQHTPATNLLRGKAPATCFAQVRVGGKLFPRSPKTDVFTIAKLLPLALLVLLGLPNVSAEVLQTQTVAEPQWTQAVLLLIFAFGGFEAPLMSAGEAKDARKDSAFALLVALGIIATVYISVQYVTIGLVPNLQQEKAPIAAAFSILWGPVGVTFASFAAMISVWGWATGNGLQSPRLLFSMAERGELPGAFSRVHARFRTPHVAIVGFSVVAGVLAIVGTFEGNAVLSAIVRLIVYALVCVSLWVFRRTKGPAQFQVPFALPVSILALGFCFYMLSTRSFAQAGIILVAMAAGHVLMLAQPKAR